MMLRLQSLVNQLKNPGRIVLFVAGVVLVLVWVIETPADLLGKADAVGYAVCHRIDLRSFHLGVRQLPLCARCTGQYVGAMLGLLFQAVFARRRAGFPPKGVLAVLGILILAYGVDGLNSYFSLPPFVELFPFLTHLYTPTNTLRLLTGTGMGVVIAVALYPAIVGTLYTQPDSRPSITSVGFLLPMIGLGVIADLLILTGSPAVLYPAALVSAVGVIILLSFAYAIVVVRILKQENTYARFSHAVLPLFTGFMLTMLQIALFDLVRYMITGTWNGFTFG